MLSDEQDSLRWLELPLDCGAVASGDSIGSITSTMGGVNDNRCFFSAISFLTIDITCLVGFLNIGDTFFPGGENFLPGGDGLLTGGDKRLIFPLGGDFLLVGETFFCGTVVGPVLKSAGLLGAFGVSGVLGVVGLLGTAGLLGLLGLVGLLGRILLTGDLGLLGLVGLFGRILLTGDLGLLGLVGLFGRILLTGDLGLPLEGPELAFSVERSSGGGLVLPLLSCSTATGSTTIVGVLACFPNGFPG